MTGLGLAAGTRVTVPYPRSLDLILPKLPHMHQDFYLKSYTEYIADIISSATWNTF
jgi:hypothetical protein